MNKKNEKQIVGIAEKVIEKFAKEWKRNPYLWESEADIHAELYNRIKLTLGKPLECKYEGYMGKYEKFSWVYCKPKIYIRGENNFYYPDIVIYKNAGKTRRVEERKNEPMLWVCEIKYATEWSSALSRTSIKNDIYKLHSLLKQKKDKINGTAHACYVIFRRNILGRNIDKILKRKDKKIKLFLYEVGDEK